MVAYNFDLILNQVVTFFPEADSLRFSTVSASQVAFAAVDSRLRISTPAGSILLDSVAARGETNLGIFSLSNLTFFDGSVLVAGDRDAAETSLDGADNVIDFGADIDLLAAQNHNNQVHGLDGNDTIRFGSSVGHYLVYGGAGADTIISGQGNNTLYGGTGLADSTDGADTFIVGSGSNDVYGNGGADSVTFSAATAVGQLFRFWGGAGNDSLTAANASGSMMIHAGPDSDVITIQNAGSTTIYGGAGADTLDMTGSTGFATIYGGNGVSDSADGNDRIITGSGSAWVYSNAGNDDVTLHTAIGHSATVYLGAGNDSLTSGVVGGQYQIWAGPGNDVVNLTGHNGNATVYGGSGNYDTLDGADTITGGSGNVVIYGNAGADVITVTPAAGRTALVYGGAGNDTITAAPADASAAITLYGNTGDDRFHLDFSTATPLVRINDYGTGTNGLDLTLSGGAAAAHVSVDRASSAANTVLRNGAGEQVFLGGFRGNFTSNNTKFLDSSLLITNFNGAASSLTGGAGSDQLIAGHNGDTLTAGTGGNDRLTGGNGNDRFIFTTATLDHLDTLSGGAGDDTLVIGTSGTAITDHAFLNISSVETLAVLSGDYGTHGFTLGSYASNAGIRTVDAIQAGNMRVDASTMTHGISYTGGTGDDVFIGTSHADSIRGGAGNDTIIGGRGNDTIRGGTGDDVFSYRGTPLQGLDTYLDVDFGTASADGAVDRFEFDASVAALNLGNNDDSVDGAIITSITSAGSAGTELIILRNVALNNDNRWAALDIINSDAAVGDGVINVFFDSSEGFVVMYYDQDGRTAGGHLKFAEIRNLTDLADMNVIDFSDFIFTI